MKPKPFAVIDCQFNDDESCLTATVIASFETHQEAKTYANKLQSISDKSGRKITYTVYQRSEVDYETSSVL